MTVTSLANAPSWLDAEADYQKVTLQWEPVDGATSYNIYRSTPNSGSEGTTVYATTPNADPTYTDSGLTNDTPYYYKVAAVGAWGTSAQSTEAGATPFNVPPVILVTGVGGSSSGTGGVVTVTGTSTTASVSATASNGQDATYDWSANGPGTVTFSPNGTSSAAAPTMTFSAAGTYTITVTATDSVGATSSDSFVVDVAQTPTSVSVLPTTVTVPVGGTWFLRSRVLDQFGDAIEGQSVHWSVDGGTGSISLGGLFTAPGTVETDTIGATSGSLGATATIHVSASGAPTGRWVPVLCYDDGSPVDPNAAGGTYPYVLDQQQDDLQGFWSLPYPGTGGGATKTVGYPYPSNDALSGFFDFAYNGSSAFGVFGTSTGALNSMTAGNWNGTAASTGSVALSASASATAYAAWRYVDSGGSPATPPTGSQPPAKILALVRSVPEAGVSLTADDNVLAGLSAHASSTDGDGNSADTATAAAPWPVRTSLRLVASSGTSKAAIALSGTLDLLADNEATGNHALASAWAEIYGGVQLLWPQVAVTAPSNGTTLTVGDTVSVTATADASVGGAALASVDLAVDGTVIASDTSAPYTAAWAVTTGTHTFTATAHYAEGIDATSEPVTVYGGATSGTLTVATHIWQPNPANVGDVITGAVTAAIDPALDGDGSGPTYVTYAWSTAGVWRSDDGTAQTFIPYSSNYVIGYTGTGPNDEFHATFMEAGYYILKVASTAIVHDSRTGASLSTASAVGYVGGDASDFAPAQGAAAAHATISNSDRIGTFGIKVLKENHGFVPEGGEWTVCKDCGKSGLIGTGIWVLWRYDRRRQPVYDYTANFCETCNVTGRTPSKGWLGPEYAELPATFSASSQKSLIGDISASTWDEVQALGKTQGCHSCDGDGGGPKFAPDHVPPVSVRNLVNWPPPSVPYRLKPQCRPCYQVQGGVTADAIRVYIIYKKIWEAHAPDFIIALDTMPLADHLHLKDQNRFNDEITSRIAPTPIPADRWALVSGLK